MTGPRLNLAGMLGVIALIGLGLGAVRSASVYWVSVASWVLLIWLCAGLLGAIYRRGRARAFWVGFALFGWIYLLLVHTAVLSTTFSAELSTAVHRAIDDLLPLDKTLTASARRMQVQHEHAVRIIRVRALADLYINFGFAVLGGLVAQAFTARGEADRQAAPAEAAS